MSTMSLAVVMSIWMSEISQPNPRVYGMDEEPRLVIEGMIERSVSVRLR